MAILQEWPFTVVWLNITSYLHENLLAHLFLDLKYKQQ